MIKIYIDTNVFSFLKRQENNHYLTEILKLKENCIFYFSDAHILDMFRDTSDKKIDDLLFFEKIVDDNCLRFNIIESNIMFESISPINLYNSKVEYYQNFDLDVEFNVKELRSISQNNSLSDYPNLNDSLNNILQFYDNFQSFDFSNFNNEFLSLFELENKLYTKEEIIKWGKDLFKRYSEDNKFYLNQRSLIEKAISNEMSTDEKENFINNFLNYQDENLSTLLSVLPICDNFFFKYIFMYLFINLYKIDKEKNKSVKYLNTFHDGLHSFYGLISKAIISEDVQFNKKTQILSQYYKINVKTFSMFEFLEESKNMFYKIENFDDFENAMNIETKLDNFHFLNPSFKIKFLDKTILGFDKLKIIKTKKTEIHVLFEKLDLILFKNQYKIYIQNIYKILGEDNFKNSSFSEKMFEEIENCSFKNLIWRFEFTTFLLMFNYENNEFQFIIEIEKE